MDEISAAADGGRRTGEGPYEKTVESSVRRTQRGRSSERAARRPQIGHQPERTLRPSELVCQARLRKAWY